MPQALADSVFEFEADLTRELFYSYSTVGKNLDENCFVEVGRAIYSVSPSPTN